VSITKEKYQKEVIPSLVETFGYRNVMQVPKVEKIVINVRVGSYYRAETIGDSG